jgi:hypothetical protein
MPKAPLKPGNKAPVSGQYGIRHKNGKDTGQERTVVKDEPLPPTPTPKPKQAYVIRDKTKTS